MKSIRNRSLRSGTAAPLTVLVVVSTIPAVHAQTTETWSPGASGLWNVAGNWSGDVVPNNGTPSGATYNVDILDGVSTVTLNATVGINDLSLAKGNTLSINDGQTLFVAGPSVSNAGAIVVNGGNGANGYLSLNGNTTLSGGGTVTLSTNPSNGGNAFIQQNTGGLTLTNTNSTIQGNGVIGNGGLTVVNGTAGIIDANVSGGALNVNNSGGLTNTGLLEATNGGNLAFNGVAVTNTGGNLTASGAGSVVSLFNTSVTGGTLNTSGGGIIESAATTTLNGVTVSTGSTYTASNNATTLVSGTLTNDGLIQINGGSGANGYLSLNANTTLSGGGTVTLSTASGGGNAFIVENPSGLTLTNTNNTIQGTGIIGSGGLALVNGTAGIIDANVSGGALNVNNSGGLTNTGLLEATNGGNLAFNGVAVTNTGGNLTANGAGSVISLFNTSVTGGTLNTGSGGAIESAGTTTLDGSTAAGAVTISSGSTYTASNNATTVVLGTITNNGTINLSGGNGANGYLAVGDASVLSATLQGAGTVNLGETAANGGCTCVQQSVGSVTLTNVNDKIQGEGIIGNGGLTLVNESGGVVDANSTGGTLTSALVLNGGGGVTNTGLLEATNSGVLQITTAVNNAGGTIKATGATAAVDVLNGSITGGTLTTTGGGTIESSATATLNGVTISKNSTFTVNNGSTTVFGGATTTNLGLIQVNGGNGGNGFFDLANSLTLAGAGTVTLSTNPSNGGNAILQQNVGGLKLTNLNNTIQGNGIIGNGGLAIDNATKGTIDANVTGDALNVNNSGGLTNTGLLEATHGGNLAFNGVAVTNTGGNLTASGTGSVISLFNTSVTGGTLNTNSGGTIESVGTTTLNGVTNSTGSTYTMANGSTTLVLGTITNDGAIQVNGGNGGNGFFNLNSNVSLSGGGTVTLSTIPSNGGNAFIQQNNGGLKLTNVNNTIQGTGVIGNGGLAVDNTTKGTIDANVSGGALNVNNSGGLTNAGLLEATNGGNLAINGVAVTNTGGNLTASGTGSVVSLFNSSVTGGTLNTNSGGAIESAGTVTLNGVTISAGSTYTSSNGSTTNLTGTITNDGAIQVNGGNGNNGFFNLNSNVSLSGGGTLTLSTGTSNGGSAWIEQNVGSLTLTNVNNTIQGNGVIGNGGLTVVNDAGGTISSNAAGGTLLINGGGGLTNLGTLAVSSGDLLHVTSGPFTNFSGTTLTGGTYNVAGTLEIDELGNAGGEIVTDAANIVLNGASASFIDNGGKNALSNLATIGAGGSFSLLGGRSFTTAGNFTNDGTLSVGSGSTFGVTGTLTNFSGTTLTGGSYDVTGTLAFPGANIVTNAANIALTGTAAQIVNSTTSGNGLANLAVNSASGGFSVLGGLDFTTAGNFTNNGVLTVGSGSQFTVAPAASLTNFSGSTLTGGTYEVLGTLAFAGANIVTNAANITLSGAGAEIENSTTSGNGLANLAINAARSSFSLTGGANLTTVGTFTNDGTLSVFTGSTFDASLGLTNFKTATSTLTGGIYDVAGTLEFPGANIVTNGAKITLNGPAAQILNSTTSANGLANLASNSSTGGFTLTGNASFTTAGNFSTAGIVSIGSGSTLTVGGTGIFTQTAGTTTDGGALAAAGGVNLSGGSLFGGGAISGNLTSSGIVTPGGSAIKTGILADSGTYTQNAAGTLDIGIAGATAGKFDVLNATTAVLGGTLNISDIKGFVPTVGSTFKILGFGSETGTFATVNGLTINAAEAYTVTYQPTDVLLTVVSTAAKATPASSVSRVVADPGRMAAALRTFNATYADERIRTNLAGMPVSRPLVAGKAGNVMELIRGHR